MFRKVQLKFFGIITAILLAIFIAVLSSINIIMDTVMEHQTKAVLSEVAAGVEYNASMNPPFSFNRLDDSRFADERRYEPPPLKLDEQPKSTTTATSAETSAETSTSVQTSETAVVTSEASAPETEEVHADEPQEETQPVPAPAEEPVTEETTAAQAFAQPKNEDDDNDDDDGDDDDDDDDKHGQEQESQHQPSTEFGGWGWGWYDPNQPNPWNNWGNNDRDRDKERDRDKDRDNDKDKNDQQQPPQWGQPNQWWIPVMPTANNGGAPVLEGYSIICGNTENTTSASTSKTTASTTSASNVPPESKSREMNPYDRMNREPVPKSLGSIDFFIIMADSEGKYAASLNTDLSEETAQQYINEILSRNASEGMANNYQFCTAAKDNGTLIVFTDKSAEMNMMKKLKRITVIVGSISVVVLSALAYFLSGLIVRPIKDAFNKQKQFISDASHELKTPLTVISANADVLAGEIGDNKWLNYIQDQTDRMNVLVNDLLNLTRLENNTSRLVFAEFDLSKAIENTALPFESQAFETNKNFVLSIDEGIRTVGSEQHVKQMTAIFIDNALKYAKDGGTVRVSLCMENGKPVLSVYNTGKGVKDSEKDKIFERFYRSDASRNRQTGGYGLGLAIAKSIIDKHRFKVVVENEEGKSICFVITM